MIDSSPSISINTSFGDPQMEENLRLQILRATTSDDLTRLLNYVITIQHDDDDDDDIEFITTHKQCTPTMLYKIIQIDGWKKAHRAAARNKKISLVSQKILVDKYFSYVGEDSPILFLARNPKIHSTIEEKLVEKQDVKVLRALIRNTKNEKVVNRLFERIYIDESIPKDAGIIASLAVHPFLDVKNINFLAITPVEEIFQLGSFEPIMLKEMLEENLALNPSLPASHVTRLVDEYINTKFASVHKPPSREEQILHRIAEKGNCTPETFEKIAKKGNPKIWVSLLRNPLTPTFCLRMILQHYEYVISHNEQTIYGIIEHPNTTKELYTQIADGIKSKSTLANLRKQMYVKGMLEDWPVEWLETHYSIKLDAKWIQREHKKH